MEMLDRQSQDNLPYNETKITVLFVDLVLHWHVMRVWLLVAEWNTDELSKPDGTGAQQHLCL